MLTWFPALLLILAALLATFAYGAKSAAPWVPMWRADMERVMRLANIQKDQRVLDLGCGDGRMVVAAASAGAIATGVEVALIPYLVARFRCAFGKVPNAKILYGDFWKMDFSQADVIFFFLTPKVYARMKEKCDRELRPGAKVVAYMWPFKDWECSASDRPEGRPAIYVYIK